MQRTFLSCGGFAEIIFSKRNDFLLLSLYFHAFKTLILDVLPQQSSGHQVNIFYRYPTKRDIT